VANNPKVAELRAQGKSCDEIQRAVADAFAKGDLTGFTAAFGFSCGLICAMAEISRRARELLLADAGLAESDCGRVW
jgi:hypothetical protein